MFRNALLLAITAFSSLFAGEKIVLFNDTSAHYHWGCTANATALKENIAALGFDLHAIPIMATYTLKEVPSFAAFDDRTQFKRFCSANAEIFKALQEARAVVINAEGTLHDMRPAPRALLYVAYISKLFLGKHVEIINHSAYPKDDPTLSPPTIETQELAERIYKKVYSQLDFIAIREPYSQKEMQKLGINSTLSFDCLPLYIDAHYHTPKQVKEKNLVISGSVAFTQQGVEELSSYMEKMSKRGFTIELLIGAAAHPSRDDMVFVETLQNKCSAPFTLVNAASLDEWLQTIQQATLFVSGRFQHSLAAFCLNTPFIALNSNTHKVHGLCSLLDQSEPLLYSDPNLLDHLLTRTETILSSPLPDNSAKFDEVCALAKRNCDGLRLLKQE